MTRKTSASLIRCSGKRCIAESQTTEGEGKEEEAEKGEGGTEAETLPDRWRGSGGGGGGGGSSGGARRRCRERREGGRVRSDASFTGREDGGEGRKGEEGRFDSGLPAAGSRAESDHRNATRFARPQAESVARGDACAPVRLAGGGEGQAGGQVGATADAGGSIGLSFCGVRCDGSVPFFFATVVATRSRCDLPSFVVPFLCTVGFSGNKYKHDAKQQTISVIFTHRNNDTIG